jgi:putative ABC transport system substrate-binding protein
LPATRIFRRGGLISYGPDIVNIYEQTGTYAVRVRAARSRPVVQSAKLEMVINLRTAKALGLKILPTLLTIGDKVIE